MLDRQKNNNGELFLEKYIVLRNLMLQLAIIPFVQKKIHGQCMAHNLQETKKILLSVTGVV